VDCGSSGRAQIVGNECFGGSENEGNNSVYEEEECQKRLCKKDIGIGSGLYGMPKKTSEIPKRLVVHKWGSLNTMSAPMNIWCGKKKIVTPGTLHVGGGWWWFCDFLGND
jgi:hypothetical protein